MADDELIEADSHRIPFNREEEHRTGDQPRPRSPCGNVNGPTLTRWRHDWGNAPRDRARFGDDRNDIVIDVVGPGGGLCGFGVFQAITPVRQGGWPARLQWPVR